VGLRVSKDGGATFGNYRVKTLISAGHFRSMLRWRASEWAEISYRTVMVGGHADGLNQAFATGIKHAPRS